MKVSENDNKIVKLKKLKVKKNKKNKYNFKFLEEDENPEINKRSKLFKKNFEESPFLAYPYLNADNNKANSHKSQKVETNEAKKEVNFNNLNQNSEVFSSHMGIQNFLEVSHEDIEKKNYISGNNLPNNMNPNFEHPGNVKSQDLTEFIEHLNFQSTESHSKIWDEHYNVDIKFLINEEGKLHEIQFTYNLLKDKKASLIEEIKREFNFSKDHLKHIYEILKKICKIILKT